jgi:hypothetical protein
LRCFLAKRADVIAPQYSCEANAHPAASRSTIPIVGKVDRRMNGRLGSRRTESRATARTTASAAVKEIQSADGKIGAGEGARTLDPDLGKVVLYH